MADVISKEKRSQIMRQVKRKNTRLELALRKSLWGSGIRGWRVNPKGLPGNPDLIFLKKKIAIFIDGCFWHGCDTCYRRPKSNQDYWDKKRERNINRDTLVNNTLHSMDWKVLRFWEHEVKKDIQNVLKTIHDNIKTYS